MAGDKSLGFSVTALDRASATFVRMAAQVERLEKRLDRLDGKTARVTVDADTTKAQTKFQTLDKSFGSATIRVAALSRALSTLAMPGAIVAATPAIASLGASAVQASGALWLLPAAATAGGIAMAGLKVGLAGFGEAMKNLDDAEKFAEAIAKLSPAAREAATTIRSLVPAWTSMQQVVQDNLFAGVAASIRELAGTYLPLLKTGLGGTATALNQFAMNFTAFAGASQTLTDVPVLFTNVNAAITNLAPVVNNLLGIFRDVAVVGSTFLPGLATGFVGATQSVQTFVHTARETGQLAVWIQNGLNTLRQLGQLAGNVGSILGSVFGAAAASGESFLSILVRVTGQIAAALKTPEGAAGLQTFFTTVRTLVGLLWDKLVQLWPAISAAGQAFAALLVEAAPLSNVIFGLVATGLVPLLDTIRNLAPILGPALVLFGLFRVAMVTTTAAMTAYRIATGLATAASVGYRLAMGTALVLTQAQAAAQSRHTAAALAGAAAARIVAAAQWLWNAALSANPITLVVLAIAALVGAFIWAWNSSETFRAIVTAAWEAIRAAAVAVFGWLGSFFTAVWTGIQTVAMTVWGAISGFFAGAFAAFQAMFSAVWNTLVAVWSAVWNTIASVGSAIWGGIAQYFSRAWLLFQIAFQTVWNAVVAIFQAAWSLISSIAVSVWNGIVAFFSPAFSAFQSMFSAVWNAVSAVFSAVWNGIRAAATAIWNAISSYFSAAFAAYQAMFQTVWNVVSTIFTTVWNFIRNTAMTIWNAIVAYFQAAFAAWTAFFQNIWNNIVAIFQTVWNFILSTAQTMWEQIRSFFAGAWAAFTGFFSDTWNNIVGIFDRVWSSVTDIAKRVWESVRRAFIDGVNFVIRIINGFAGAINKVAGLLGFNINLHVDEIPYAGGGPIEAARRALGGPIDVPWQYRATGGGIDATGGGRLPATGTLRDTLPAVAGRQRYLLQGKEWIIRSGASRSLGARKMAMINQADRRPVDVIPRDQMRKRVALYARGGGLAPIPMASAGEIAAAASALVPGSRMSSGYRPGDPGMHGRNQAADMVGNLGAINRAWAGKYGASTNELIYTPGINLLDGRPHRYNAATRADHFDHVHIGHAGPLGEGGGVLAAVGDFFQALLRPVVEALLSPLRNMIVPIRDNPAEGFGKRMLAGVGVKMLDFLIGLAADRDEAAAASGLAGPGSGPVVDQVRAVAERFGWGGGPQWDALSRLIMKESSWNPNAQNPTSTAYGLFQFLNSTWGTVGGRKTSNPGEQAEYGLRYIRQRYGSPVGALNFHNANNWYDRGGLARGQGVMLKETLRPERVLDPRTTVTFERFTDWLASPTAQRALSARSGQFGVLNPAIAQQMATARAVRRAVAAGGGGGVTVNIESLVTPPGTTASGMASAITRELRVAKHGGRYR